MSESSFDRAVVALPCAFDHVPLDQNQIARRKGSAREPGADMKTTKSRAIVTMLGGILAATMVTACSSRPTYTNRPNGYNSGYTNGYHGDTSSEDYQASYPYAPRIGKCQQYTNDYPIAPNEKRCVS